VTSPANTTVDFWFDPLCPWAWMTSRWMLQVEDVRPVEARFHVMSLSLLNEEKEVSDDYRRRMVVARGPVRACVAASREAGEDVLRPLYTALGTRIHVQSRDIDENLVGEALEECGLPRRLADSMADEEYDGELRVSHDRAMALVGDDVGTPVIAFDDFSIFGPVVTPAPKGEAAGRLWDGLALFATTPGFFELKRSRTSAPDFS